MTLTEMLLSADEKIANTLKKGTYKSRRLARVLGQDGTCELQITELAPAKINTMSEAKSGNNMEIYNRICLEGITEPNLKNPDLLKKFGCSTPLSLTEKIFSLEVAEIAEAIIKLSDIAPEEQENEIKN